MKKYALSCLLAVLASTGVAAQRQMFLGGGLGYGTEARETLPDWTATSLDLQLSYLVGSPFGLYVTYAIGYPLSATAAGAAVDMDLYSLRMSTDVVFGLGYRIPVRPPLAVAVGAGLYMGVAFLFPDDYADPSYGGSLSLGPGIQGMVTILVLPGLQAGVSFGAGYSLIEPLPLESGEFRGGFHVFAGIGVSFPF